MQGTNNPAETVQGTAEWHEARIGRFTASQYFKLMVECKREMNESELKAYKEANPKGRATTIADPKLLAQGALTYVEAIASERATKMPADDDLTTFAMQWGKDQEPKAKMLYGAAYDIVGEDVGFIPYLDYAGASPDWIVKGQFGCEIKCPISRAMHMKYRTIANANDLKENHANHYWQCMGAMLSTGLKMWKFISYHPHYEPVKQLKIVNVPWNDADIALLKIKLEAADKACKYLLTL